ncbi:hypothetical protein R1flu_026840 [Riccia fluitans]|uniref:Uncharacterized protein n=1 Tax=Riccia fluitans TaxID=41844 RepID=A0ABD1XH47_9MARC
MVENGRLSCGGDDLGLGRDRFIPEAPPVDMVMLLWLAALLCGCDSRIHAGLWCGDFKIRGPFSACSRVGKFKLRKFGRVRSRKHHKPLVKSSLGLRGRRGSKDQRRWRQETGEDMEGLSGWRQAWTRRRQRSADSRRLWALVEPYRPPPRVTPLLVLNVVGFYSGLIAAAVTEQLYKEKYWEEHPGQAVPIMHPLLYFGPYKVTREDFSSEEGSG